MMTKMITAVMLSGALWVAGDAGYRQFDCCFLGSECCELGASCCPFTAAEKTSDCCAVKAPCCEEVRDCCGLVKTNTVAQPGTPCCDATITYCTRTEEIYLGCCCEVVNGQFRCVITGEVSDECCCIPIE